MGIDVNSVTSVAHVNFEFDCVLSGEAWISYTNSTLFARMVNKNLTPSKEWTLAVPLDLTFYLPELVVVGFSSSCGESLPELHKVFSWNFTSILTIPDANYSANSTANDSQSYRARWFLPVVIVSCLLPALYLVAMFITVTIIAMRRRREHKTRDQGAIYNADYMGGAGRTRRFSYSELSAATNGFDEEERLGQGGFGGVYKGVLRDTHEVVAVKRLAEDSSQGKKEFIAEVTIISQLCHPNLVRLIGWCQEQEERLLVYQHMEGGSLDSHLFSESNAKQVLPWGSRMKIAMDVASAVQYLHEEWVQCVVHRDIKTSNVMIDSEFHARLGDFGLARLVNHGRAADTTMVVKGTMGYLAPECFSMGKVGKESDVYSFGVVLLEIACGRRASVPIGKPEKLLAEWVWWVHSSGSGCGLLEVVDKRLSRRQFNAEEAERMLMVGLWCTLQDRERRPTIREAIRTLSFQTKVPDLPPQAQQIPAVVSYNVPAAITGGSSEQDSSFQQGSARTTTNASTATTSRSSNSTSSRLQRR